MHFAIPHIAIVLVSALLYPNYITVYNADEYWSSVLILFPFWAILVSYQAILINFNVVKWKALIWLIILPVVFNLLAFGVILWAYSVFA